MKVLLVNGSPKANGNTARALAEVAEQLNAEGLATMRNIGKNMAWLLRCIEAGQAVGIEAPEADRARTNFIR